MVDTGEQVPFREERLDVRKGDFVQRNYVEYEKLTRVRDIDPEILEKFNFCMGYVFKVAQITMPRNGYLIHLVSAIPQQQMLNAWPVLYVADSELTTKYFSVLESVETSAPTSGRVPLTF
jgi:hypothetical protein